MASYQVEGKSIRIRSNATVIVTKRAKTVLVEGYVWAGHQSSAAEGKVQVVRVVRPTVEESVAELKARWDSQAGQTSYVGFGGQFRHVEHMSRKEVEEVIDDVNEVMEEVGTIAV